MDPFQEYLDHLEEVEDEEEDNQQDLTREPRVLWERSNILLEYNDIIFKSHFRFCKANVLILVDLLEPFYQAPRTNRMSPLSPLQKTGLGLLFLASDSFQRICGLTMGVKTSCANHGIHQFIRAVCEISRNFITLPTVQEMSETSEYVAEKYGLAGVAMGVDGSPARLGIQPYAAELPDGLSPQDFWGRKQYYAINFQVAGDHKKIIRDIVCTFPGSTHDSRVYRNSAVKAFIEGQQRYYLVGDSAYPLTRWMMKPFAQREITGHPRRRAFNRALSGARTELTENVIGLMKQRWPCLRMGIRMQPDRASKVILACATLHNLGINLQDPLPQDEPSEEGDDDEEEDDEEDAPEENGGGRAGTPQANLFRGRLFRDQLMANGNF